MNWEYFILFAIAALVCWALGAFAAWKGTKPGWAYGFTFLGLAIFFSFIIGMWISLERPLYLLCKRPNPSLLPRIF